VEQATFHITGGYLEIEKTIFAKELLRSQSFLKSIIKPQNLGQNGKPPLIVKSDSSMVTVEYNNVSDIKLADNYDTELRNAKMQFKGQLKGRLTLRISSYNAYHITLDLNSDDDKIKSN